MAEIITRPAVHLDSDPGADDALALIWLCALHHTRKVRFQSMTTVGGNVGIDATTENARRLLALCDRADVALTRGKSAGGEQARHVHGHDGLSGLRATLPASTQSVSQLSIDRPLAEAVGAADVVIAIGPLSNVASRDLASNGSSRENHPGRLVAGATPGERTRRHVVMGGALRTGNITPTAEFNIFHDPAAWAAALSTLPLDVVPLDITKQVYLDHGALDVPLPGPIGAFLNALFRGMIDNGVARFGAPRFLLHDAVAVAAVAYPDLIDFRPACLEVVTSGKQRGTLVEHKSSVPNARVASSVDAPALVAALLDDLAVYCAAASAGP